MSSPRFLQGDNGKWSRNRIQNIILLGTAILGVLFFIVGIILLCTYISYDGSEIVIDYTDCTPTIDPIDTLQTKCKDVTDKECSCYIPISITEPMKAPVTVFYELDSYDQITNNYSHSRDDDQLGGHLSPKPADSCGQFYTYVETTQGKMPIAPCGQLADAMFNDTFSLQTNNKYVPTFRTGLISKDDKKQFHNPSGNLPEAFKSFSKPINWKKNVWELDTKNPDNNGFENEAFIIWMKTDLKRKPVFRVNHVENYEHGVPAGNYTLRVIYRYPTSRYDGRRKCIISSVQKVVNSVTYGFGVGLFVIGLLIFISASLLIRRRPVIWRDRDFS